MVCFVNVESVDRIIFSIFQRLNLEWKNRGPARQRVRSRRVAMERLVGRLLIGRRSRLDPDWQSCAS